MATGKRASMREGPLADLFRKTAEDVSESPSRGSAPPAREPEPPAREPEPPAREPEPPARKPEPPAPEAHAPEAEASTSDPEAPARAVRPHPSLDAQLHSPAQFHQPEIPDAQQRLRNAFPGEAPASERYADIPAPDPYARTERELAAETAPPAPAGGPVLRVVGVGGAGVNAVNRMVEADISGVEFMAINTDLQSLQLSAADQTLHIGDSVTRGLGSGSDPEKGRLAAKEEHDRIKAMLRGSDMVFIAAGAGLGTGTGAAPVVAQIARELGALTVGIVTRPFQFEGSRRGEQAEIGIESLGEQVDTLIVVPNNRLLSVLDRGVSMVEAFRVADDVLRQGVQGISDLVTLPGLINLDFADVRTIMSEAGNALLGIGMGTGDRRAIDAAEQAVASPLLETSMEGARSILLSITGGRDISLWEVNEAAKAVSEAAHPDANIIFGAMVDDKLEDQVWVTVVATGYGDQPRRAREQDPFAAQPPVTSTPSTPPAPEAPARRPSRQLREPAGEPRVTRVRRPVVDLDVPEFIPPR